MERGNDPFRIILHSKLQFDNQRIAAPNSPSEYVMIAVRAHDGFYVLNRGARDETTSDNCVWSVCGEASGLSAGIGIDACNQRDCTAARYLLVLAGRIRCQYGFCTLVCSLAVAMC
jgi:hypothetical protein